MKPKSNLALAVLLFLLVAPGVFGANDTTPPNEGVFDVICRANGTEMVALLGKTTYEFEFEVGANEIADEAIRKFVLTLPDPEYDLDLDTLVAPTALTHVGETPGSWQVAYDAETYTITYEYFDATDGVGVGNIRAGEGLVFSFTATTDPGLPGCDDTLFAECKFAHVLFGDGAPPTVVESWCAFPVPVTDDDDTTGDDDNDNDDDNDDNNDDDHAGCGC